MSIQENKTIRTTEIARVLSHGSYHLLKTTYANGLFDWSVGRNDREIGRTAYIVFDNLVTALRYLADHLEHEEHETIEKTEWKTEVKIDAAE
jgi:hypothetical protein